VLGTAGNEMEEQVLNSVVVLAEVLQLALTEEADAETDDDADSEEDAS